MLAGVSLLVGCFANAPVGGSSSAGSSGDASTGTTDATMGTTGADDSTGADAETTSTTSGSMSSDTGADTSSTTSVDPPEACVCPPQAWLCDGFEDFPGEWTYPSSPGVVESDPSTAQCGEQALRTSVDGGEAYSVAQIEVPATPNDLIKASFTARALIHIGSGCLMQPELVRVFEVRLRQDRSGLAWYYWRVALLEDQVAIVGANQTAPGPVPLGDTITPDTWHDLRLHVDFTGTTPRAVVEIDGVWVVTSATDAPLLSSSASFETTTPNLTLGAFMETSTFQSTCEVLYDELWIASD